jgi:hypothetical protein
MRPSGVRLHLQLEPTDTMNIQLITTVTAKHSVETALSQYSSVSVYCGETLLTSMSDIKAKD